MSRGINKHTIIGYLGKEPEIRFTGAGTKVASFSVATSESWKNKDTGEPEERTEWHTVVAFDKRAEFCEKHLSIGRQVYIEGPARTEVWTPDDGIKRQKTKIYADVIEPLGSKPEATVE